MTTSVYQKYKSCVTFGRFNIAHPGHIDLIEKMLQMGEQVFVYVSEGALNNSWDLRVLLLKVLCRRSNLDVSRVTFKKAINPYSAVKEAISLSDYGETSLVLGSDQHIMGSKLSLELDVPFTPNERTCSSTKVRSLIDNQDEETLSSCYLGDKYAVRLAKLLRLEETCHEKPC